MQRKTQDALANLASMIKFGQVGRDGVLPSERDLSEKLRIGRGAVRSVLRRLCESGRLQALPNGRMKLNRDTGDETLEFHRFLLETPLPCGSPEALRIMSHLADNAAALGVEMVLSVSGECSGLAERCVGGHYSGVIFFEQYRPDDVAALARLSIPAMVANVEMDCDLPSVGVDYRQIGRLAGRTLVEAGHRRIGYAGGPADAYVTKGLIAGLKGALAEDDIEPDFEAFCELPLGMAKNYDRVVAALNSPRRPSAFVLGRDYLAQYFYQACRELRLRIPEDVSLIGYDNLSWPDAGEFGLTTIAQPVEAISREAVAMLRRLAVGDRSCCQVRLPGELVCRQSVARLPAVRSKR